MKLYFIRHGESEANVERVISNRGWVHPLTEKGRMQAATVAERLPEAGIVKVYCSPLRRAVETGEIVARLLGVALETNDALREFDCGVAEGRADAEAWQLNRQVGQDWIAGLRWENRIEGGESFLDMQRRFVPFLAGLLDEYQARAESLALVGHGALFYFMLPLVLNNISRTWISGRDFPNTGCVIAESGPNGLTCLEWIGVQIHPMETK